MSIHVRREEEPLAKAVEIEPALPSESGFCVERLNRLDRWLDGYVSSGRMPGASVAVVRGSRVVYMGATGYADPASKTPMGYDTLARIKSMTKPLTSSLAMSLYEEGRFALDDSIATYLPSFAEQRVLLDGPWDRPRTCPARRDITFHDLLTHTGGLTYGFMGKTPVDQMYRHHGVDFQLDSPLRAGPPTRTLAEMVESAAHMPLLCHPGERWNYSISTDVLGHLIEVLTGLSLPEAMQQRIFEPLKMDSSSFTVPASALSNLAAHHGIIDGRLRVLDDPKRSRFASLPTLHSGGGGVVTTIADYVKFCRMLLTGGDESSHTVLGRKTIQLMTMNHLPGDLAQCGEPFQGDAMPGQGFGLGVSITLDPARRRELGSVGDFGWNGSASTTFWVDPVEDLIVIFFAQVTPDWLYPFRKELRTLVYQALVS